MGSVKDTVSTSSIQRFSPVSLPRNLRKFSHAWSRKGRSPGCCQSGGANDRPHCSNGREFTVILPEFLRPAGWDCFRRTWQAGIPGALRQSLGTAINLHDGLAIHRGEPEQSCGGPQPGSANFVRTDPRSRYGRKSWFSSQEAWLVHPVAWLVHPVACSLHPEGVDSAGAPRARRGVPLPPRIVPRRGTWWAPPRCTPAIERVVGVNVLQVLHEFCQHGGHLVFLSRRLSSGCSWRQ